MTSTTHPEFGAATEAIDVAKAFADKIHGKTIVVTGGNRNGVSFSTLEAFASQSPSNLIVAGRTPSKVQETIDVLAAKFPSVKYRALHIDLGKQESVRAAANEILAWSDIPAIDILVNTAGVMGIQERTLTKEGIEMHFATNHIGHWLFSCLIMPKLIKASETNPKGATRIINVSSASATVGTIRWSDINFEKKNKDLPQEEQPNYPFLSVWGFSGVEDTAYNPIDAYNRSKVANVLSGIAANKRLFEKTGILSLSIHPGVIATELARDFAPETLAAAEAWMKSINFTYKTQGAGASTSLVAALDPKLGVPEIKNGRENYGAFMEDCQISEKALPLATSSSEAERLWELSEKLVNQTFAW